MLQTSVLKILYLACKLCPDSSREPEPVGAAAMFVTTVLKVVRTWLLRQVDGWFAFKKLKACHPGTSKS